MGKISKFFKMSDDRKLRSGSTLSSTAGISKPSSGAVPKNTSESNQKIPPKIVIDNSNKNPIGSSTSRVSKNQENLIPDTAHTSAASTNVPLQTAQISQVANVGNNVVPPFSPGSSHDSNSETSNSSIPSPEFSSLTAYNIRQDFVKRREDQTLRLNDKVAPTIAINEEGLTLQDYIRTSVKASQASMLSEMKNMIQELIRTERITNSDTNNPHSVRAEQSGLQPPNLDMSRPSEHSRLPTTNIEGPRSQYHLPMSNFQQLSLNNFANLQPPLSSHPPPVNGMTGNDPPPPDPYNNRRNNVPPYQQPSWNASAYTPSNHERNIMYRMDKWGIKFDGTTKTVSIEDFLFRVEAMREDNQCSYQILMKGFHHLLSGEAYEWLWSYRRQYPDCEWDQLRASMVKKFRRHESDYEIQRKIMERRQGYNENCESFINDIICLRNQMKNPTPERDFVKMVKENLKDNILQLVYPMKIVCIEQLVKESKRAEQNILKRRQDLNRMRTVPKVHELEYEDPQSSFLDVHALHTNGVIENKRTCWNCKLPGHSFYECTSTVRNVFCYRCGQDSVITPNCPKCSENRKGNMSKTGNACSNRYQQQ